jgi:hypothetical protein
MTTNNDLLDQPFVTFLRHLRTEKGSMKVRRDGAPPKWSDEQMHVAAFERNPEVYALMAVTEAQSWQRARILFQLLRSSRSVLSPLTRHTLERAAKILLAVLHPDQVFTVFLALRRCRANHKHTSRNILNYILNHPSLEDMALKHRPILVDCLEHALGKNVARASAKLLSEGKSGDRYLRRNLLRFARNQERVEKVIPFLFGKGQPPAAGQSYPSQLEFEAQLKGGTERPATVTATNRGDIAATLVHIYRGGQSPDLVAALERYVADAAAKLPRFDGKMALVLDASASTRGYGEREFCCISQSVALMMVLKKCCSHLSIFQVGGTISANLPAAEGPTDLAIALLDALATDSDVVAVVSDGYENLFDGDFRKVVASLQPSGVKTPVVFCHSKFTWMDDLTMRRPALLPELEFWHQAEFEDVIISLIATANGAERDKCLRNFLLHKLEEMETKFSVDANDHSKLFPAAVQEGR